MRFGIYIIVGLFSVILFYGCKSNTTKSKEEQQAEFEFPYIKDTMEFEVFDMDQKYLSHVEYSFLYVGKIKDTIIPNYRMFFPGSADLPRYDDNGQELPSKRNLTKDPYFYQYGRDEKFEKHCLDSKVRIEVDTNTMMVNMERLFVRGYKSYPVLLTNLEKDTIIIGNGSMKGVAPIIMEAQDRNGVWRPIEEIPPVKCDVGVGKVILPPNQVALTSALIYFGDYETELRLKLGKNYSKPFRGTINYSQFTRENP